MTTICDHPECGAPAKRIAAKVSTWHCRPTFDDENIDVEFTEFSADLCEKHAGELLTCLRGMMTERGGE